MIKIISVLKTGGEFTLYHVEKLYNMCNKYITIPYEFFCFSDDNNLKQNNTLKNIKIVPLKYNLNGWWSKFEVYQLGGPCLYLDLDTIIISNINHIINILEPYELVYLRDVYHKDYLQASMLYWNNDKNFILNEFLDNFKNIDQLDFHKRYHTPDRPFSDQDILHIIFQKYNLSINFFQDITNEIVSYKADLNNGNNFNENIHKIIFFHGKPRPWEQFNIPY